MKFKDLFKKVGLPKNDGKSQEQQGELGSKAYFVTLTNLDDTPSYDLIDVLSIGSSSADIVIEDPSIAPKHCTFFNNNGVLSVIDHSSETGTFVNEKQIPNSRMIILKEEDFIRAGELEIEIGFEVIEVSEPLNIEPKVETKIESSPAASLDQSDAPDKQVIKAPIDSTQEINIDQLETQASTEIESQDNPSLNLDSTSEIVVEDLSNEASTQEQPRIDEDATSDIDISKLASNTEEATNTDLQIEENFEQALERRDEKEKKVGFFKKLFSRKKKPVDSIPEVESEAELEIEEPKEEPKADKKVKKPSIFARIFSKKEKSQPRKTYEPEQKKRKSFKPAKAAKAKAAKSGDNGEHSSANSFSRLIGFIGELLLTATAYQVISETAEYKDLVSTIDQKSIQLFTTQLKVHFDTHLAAYWAKVPEVAMKAIKSALKYRDLFYLYFILKTIFTVVIGVGLAQFLTGLGSTGNALWKRIGGVLREVLGVVLFPLAAFDFLTLFGVKPFREVLSFTKITLRSKFAFLLGIVFGLPILIALFLISPLFQEAKMIKPIMISQAPVSKVEKVEDDLQEKVEVVSNHFQVKLAVSLMSDFLIYPSLELKVGQSERIIMNSMTFESVEQDLKVDLSVVKNSILSNLLYKAVQFDPLIQQKFPQIKAYALDASTVNANFKKPKMTPAQKKNLTKEIKDYLKLSFSMSVEGLIKHVPEYGPFLMGYVKMKRHLVKGSQLDFVDSASFQKISGNEFLVLSSTKSIAAGRAEYVYIPLDLESMNILKFTVKANRLNPKKLKFFKERILANMQPLASKSNTLKLNERNNVSSFEIFDYFSLSKSPKQMSENDQLINQYLFENLFNTAKQVVQNGNDRLHRRLERSLEKTIKSFEILNEDTKDNDYDLIIKKLSELLGALRDKNTEYFGTNLRA